MFGHRRLNGSDRRYPPGLGRTHSNLPALMELIELIELFWLFHWRFS